MLSELTGYGPRPSKISVPLPRVIDWAVAWRACNFAVRDWMRSLTFVMTAETSDRGCTDIGKEVDQWCLPDD
jgi:hypothetical protein